MSFSKILIANRGEIACRIIRSAHALGYRTVAIYSDADAQAPHVALADEACHIGPAPVRESYLSVEAILAAAKQSGADAIHPGYGFLSENAVFARACTEAGLVFIGPSASAIENMGEKRRAKKLAMDAGLPCAPGYLGEKQERAVLIEEARKAGFPLLIKAAAGGGGRGMRIVREEAELESRLEAAQAEAENAFGDGAVYLERLIENGHHIEIQILADHHGHVIHLGERECSLQRRHQKIIEEAPSPLVDAQLRKALGKAAVDLAKSIGYIGVGTVEFIVEDNKDYYFLEMNTRLQVEHPVTEMITGLDLVALQLRVAANESLPLTQDEVTFSGHAFEARLYAEDPYAGFLPQSGPIICWSPPESPDVRVDAGIEAGCIVSPFYDPMLAKIIVHGRNRNEALRKLRRALQDCVVLGVTTNRIFLQQMTLEPAFQSQQVTTAWLDRHGVGDAPSVPDWIFMAAALLLCLPRDSRLSEWLAAGEAVWALALANAGNVRRLRVIRTVVGALQVSDEGATHEISITRLSGHTLAFCVGGHQRHVAFAFGADELHVQSEAVHLVTRDVSRERAASLRGKSAGSLRSPMNGRVMQVFVAEGEDIAAGAPVAVVEAMKMHMEIRAHQRGRVSRICVVAGQQVSTGHLIAEIDIVEPVDG